MSGGELSNASIIEDSSSLVTDPQQDHSGSGEALYQEQEQGSSGGGGSIALMVAASAAIFIFGKSHLDTLKMQNDLKKLQPLKYYRSGDQPTDPVRLLFVNPQNHDALESVKRAFAHFQDDVQVIPKRVRLFSGCDVDLSTIDAVTSVIREEVLEAFETCGGKDPCLMHRMVVTVDNHDPELFISPSTLVSKRGGVSTMTVRHVVAWTVNGKVAEWIVRSCDGHIAKHSPEEAAKIEDLTDAFTPTHRSYDNLLRTTSTAKHITRRSDRASAPLKSICSPEPLFIQASLKMMFRGLDDQQNPSSQEQQGEEHTLPSYDCDQGEFVEFGWVAKLTKRIEFIASWIPTKIGQLLQRRPANNASAVSSSSLNGDAEDVAFRLLVSVSTDAAHTTHPVRSWREAVRTLVACATKALVDSEEEKTTRPNAVVVDIRRYDHPSDIVFRWVSTPRLVDDPHGSVA